MTTDIKPDTSLYQHDMPSRLRAQALIIEGQRAGRAVQVRPHGDAGWHDGSLSGDSSRIDYRLKPEPRVVWIMQREDGSLCHDGYCDRCPQQTLAGYKPVRFVELPE